MPVLTREARLLSLERQLDQSLRYIDFAVQFAVYGRTEDGEAVPTGELSQVYGGVLDTWSGHYTGECPKSPTVLPCSGNQLKFLVDDKPQILAVGARGGGKSEATKTKALAWIAMLPSTNGEIISDSYRHVKVMWQKILADMPDHWIADIKLADREIHLINGVIVRFVSSRNPDSLRAWGGAWALVDEAQDVVDEAIDIAWLSLRETNRPRLCQVGTAKAGIFRDRYDKMEASEHASLHHFSAMDNPFIPRAVYEIAKKTMGQRLYRQEVLAEWVAEADRVYEFFDMAIHCKSWINREAVLKALYGGTHRKLGEDITKEVCRRRFGKGAANVVGVDFNFSPMCALVYRILRAPEGVQDIMWAVDEVIIDERADASRLARELKRRGYANSVAIADTSDNRAKAYYRQIKAEGIPVFRPARDRRNPAIKDRVAAVSAKLLNVDNETTLFFDPKKCPRTIQAFSRQTNDEHGKPVKGQYDHYTDAGGYPIIKLYPAAAGIDRIRPIYAR